MEKLLVLFTVMELTHELSNNATDDTLLASELRQHYTAGGEVSKFIVDDKMPFMMRIKTFI